jgi:hypothetical protein
MEEIDLNIDNYELSDLLKLFKLDIDFDVNDLKGVKRKVVKLHPDKSGLPNEYFIFFRNVYDILKHLYEYKKQVGEQRYVGEDRQVGEQRYVGEERQRGEERAKHDVLTSEEKESLDIFFQKNKDLNFHKWFNETFEQIYDGDALEDFQTESFCHLDDVFEIDKSFEDTDVHRFRTVSELETFRTTQDTKPLSRKQSLMILEKEQTKEKEKALERAYKYLQREKKVLKKKQIIFFNQLQN